jgi:hypothetical protein
MDGNADPYANALPSGVAVLTVSVTGEPARVTGSPGIPTLFKRLSYRR